MGSKKGQEEIVGFAMIVIIVAIALLLLFTFYVRGNAGESGESFEAESFVQSTLQYTTDCGNSLKDYSIQDLISECRADSSCQDGRSSCEVLDSSLREILAASWPVGENRPNRGYSMSVSIEGENLIYIDEGILEGNFRNALQNVNSKGDSIEVLFRVYSR